MDRIRRRTFLTRLAAGATTGILYPWRTLGQSADPAPKVVVVHGKDIAKMVAAGIRSMGGWGGIVKQGKKAVLKPNAAWASRPEQGGNTAPALVGACVAACVDAGASEVVLPENPCSGPDQAFGMSGIETAVKKAGGRMYAAKKGAHFRHVSLPKATNLKEADVVADVLDAPCLINMPVAKSHGGATLTLSMKNWMGSVEDRRYWHGHDLHQCIADFSTLVKPSLVIIDATRIMLTKGPRGPGKLAHPGQIVFSRDPVAADAYAATLFEKKPFDVPHIKIAHAMKVGCGDLAAVDVVHIKT